MKPFAASFAAVLTIPFVLTGCASAERPTSAPIFVLADSGYLSSEELTALAAAVPLAPEAGSPGDRDDRVRSNRFRTLEQTDRWLLATAHAEVRPPLALQHFDCALGLRRGSDGETPTLDRMAAKAFHDVRAVTAQVAARARRARPVADDPGRPACERLTSTARDSAAYPSLGAAAGAAYAEVLAALDPDHAGAVRRTGRQIGVSRMVCAMNYPSDVAAGAGLGRAVALQIIATPAFQAEVEQARRELAARRATGLTNPGCAAERAALAATAAD